MILEVTKNLKSLILVLKSVSVTLWTDPNYVDIH